MKRERETQKNLDFENQEYTTVMIQDPQGFPVGGQLSKEMRALLHGSCLLFQSYDGPLSLKIEGP